ncbi:YceI family protein [Winogradskyella psychrotolerans]|uniref:YceI family protein n=1 Tax=Winogradskyella psychrotolerans TaxID=1344585 RepID=UPI001C069934|nr:YceI family protein [Winogradskyella psychrotolerans]MBU2927339.1 YceI family protein [Winogradskyella psychrotolerans]
MKNKNSKIAMLLILALSFMSYTTLKDKTVKVEDSSIIWKGYKVGGEHTGTINLKSGMLSFDGATLTGGTFTIDMTSINTTDLQGEYKGKLDGHLKSDDFFGVEEFPTATLKITSVTGNDGNYNVKADITIKGKTEAISFPMIVKGNSATANLKIDRTKHNITYKSPSLLETIKDKAIYDDFDLNVTLKF